MAEDILINDISPRIQYTGDGTQVAFTYPFPIFADADIEAYLDDELKVLSTDYSVSGAGNDNGGTVTFVAAPVNGVTVTLVRNLTVERTSDFQESGEFRAKVINAELDKIVAMIQEVEAALARALRLSSTDAAVDLVLPDTSGRANLYLAFDGSGAPIAAANPGGYPASGFMATVLDDPDAAAARATLGAEAADPDILKADASDTLTVGMLGSSYNLGNLNSATTLSIANGNIQHGTMTGSFTLTAPDDTDAGYLELELTMDATGGHALTLSGFNEIAGAFDNAANVVNLLRVSKLNANTYLEITQAI